MENPDDPIELELVLDALVRRPNDATLRSVVTRAAKLLKSESTEQTSYGSDHWLGGRIAGLVVIADGGRPRDLEAVPSGQLRFLERRLREVEKRLEQALAEPLLAAPDHGSGWISPSTLVDRVNRLVHPPGPADVVAALLRLHPDGREEAATDLKTDGEVAAALRYALGGHARPADVVTASWWVGAGRARAPFADDPLLAEAGLNAAGQSGPACPVPIAVVTPRRIDDGYGPPVTVKDVDFRIECPGQQSETDPDVLQPTTMVTFHDPDRDPTCSAREWFGWAATTVLADADHFLVEGLPRLVSSAADGYISSSYDDQDILDALAHHPGRFGRLAATAIAIGLSVHRPEDRVRAVDLVIDAAQGRCPPEAIGRGLADLSGVWTANRVATGLRTASAAGASAAVVDILGVALPSLDRRHPGLSSLLDVLSDDLARTGTPLRPALRDWLHGFTGTSRSAHTARAILSR